MSFVDSSESLLHQVSLEALEAEGRRRATEKSLRGGITKARRRCRTFTGFMREAWPILEPMTDYVHGWHLDLIAAHLEAITWGTFLKMGLSNRIIFNEPPGMMKSLQVSVMWPAWEWGPCDLAGMRYLTTSAMDENVVRDTRKMRDLIESDWYQQLFPHVKLTRRSEMNFANTKNGTREGRAFSALTGGRGNRVIVDDPNNVVTAEFEKGRERAAFIARKSLPSRINDPRKDAIIVIMQRLHEGDIAGILESMPELGYIKVMLPMRFEKDRRFVSPLGPDYSDPRTEEGELLFEEFMTEEAVARLELSLGSVDTAGQLQQRPAPRGGLTFKKHNFPIVKADMIPAGCRWVRGWDFAASTDEDAAYTCGLLLGRDPKGVFYIRNVIRERVSNPEPLVKITADQDKQALGAVEVDVPQDPGAAGKVQRTSILTTLAGHVAWASPETGDKETRALPVATQSEAGNFRVVEGPWNEVFYNELELFPKSRFKDQIDALSRAFSRFVNMPTLTVVIPVVMTQPRVNFGDHPESIG